MKRAPVVNQRAFRLALDGFLPGESLDLSDADRLLSVLLRRGWSDIEVGVHTKWTLYTVARKRDRLKMKENIQ